MWAGHAGPSQSFNQDEIQRALRESLRTQREPQPGTPLQHTDLLRNGLYYEYQDPASDTCGMNALNNLCQRPQFKTADLQKAEAAHAQAQEGGQFALAVNASCAPKGFFDVEALKIAASAVDLEIVDVEPVIDYRKSRCFAFSEAATDASEDGSWFLGFLVYDRQPGQMHYYALRRDERFKGIWLKLDSLLGSQERGDEPRNRRLTEEDLWSLYEGSRQLFQSWLLRWYPVVYRAGAAKAVVRCLGSGVPRAVRPQSNVGSYKISEKRAAAALRLPDNCWVVSNAVRHLLQDLPVQVVRELLVKFARPSEAEMRKLLEATDWDLTAAQPKIDNVFKQRIALAQGVDTGKNTLRALSLCDWEPVKAATLLSLQLQTGADVDRLQLLHEALELARYDGDRAEALLRLITHAGVAMSEAASLLADTGTWSLQAAQRVLHVRKRFPRVPVSVCMEVLKRNDDDPHAAGDFLAEYQARIQRRVLAKSSGEDLYKGEEVAVADTALSATDWHPDQAFPMAESLAVALQQTRQMVRSRGCPSHFPADMVLSVLTASDMNPQAAAAALLGAPLPADLGGGMRTIAPPTRGAAISPRPGAHSGVHSGVPHAVPQTMSARPSHRPPVAHAPPEEDDSCAVM